MKNKDKIKFMKIATLAVIGLAFFVLPATVFAAKPTTITRPATSITETEAVLNADYNSNGAATDVWFELGASHADVFSGAGTKVNEIFGLTGLGPINHQLTGLTSGTVYYYRFSASSVDGARAGSVQTFSTVTPPPPPPPVVNPPTTITRPATSITETEAVLNADYNSNGAATDVWFELGASHADVFSGAGTKVNEIFGLTGLGPINHQLTGLTSGTVYYYRFSASNSAGDVSGSISNFTTVSTPIGNPVPILTSILPVAGTQGQTLNVVLTGADFVSGVSSVDFGAGIIVNSTTVNSSTSITANITISSSATVGARNVIVTNATPGGGVSGAQTFTVNAVVVVNPPGGGGGGGGYVIPPSNNDNSNLVTGNPLKPVAATSLATFVTLNSAKLGGVADIRGTASTTAYFEYGKTVLMNNTTSMQSVGSSGATDFSATLENLDSNTIYYFRAVVTNQYGTDRGVIRIFKTKGSVGVATSNENRSENIVEETNLEDNTIIIGETEGENTETEEVILLEDGNQESLIASVVAGARNLAPHNMPEWLFLVSVILGLVLLARHLFFVAV